MLLNKMNKKKIIIFSVLAIGFGVGTYFLIKGINKSNEDKEEK